jgi:hypothetical protein
VQAERRTPCARPATHEPVTSRARSLSHRPNCSTRRRFVQRGCPLRRPRQSGRGPSVQAERRGPCSRTPRYTTCAKLRTVR